MNKINKLERRACKLTLSQEYNGLEESLKRLDMLSFDQSVFLNLRSVAQNNYVVPQAKCNLFKGSLSYSGAIIWNTIS